jgi:hypothetical protein
MSEIVILGLAIGVVFSLFSSLVLLRMGFIIDRFPTEYEDARERSIYSPVEFTRLSVILFWILFGMGGYMVLQGTRLMLVAGIATLFGICMYLITAVIFSIAVYNLMRSKKPDRSGTPSPSGFLFGALGTPGRGPAKSPEQQGN